MLNPGTSMSVLFLLMLCACGVTAERRFKTTDSKIEVATTLGIVRGVYEKDPRTGRGVAAFYNIPFAQPPVKNLRFAPPVEKTPWQNVIDCTKKDLFKVCPQFEGIYGSEDCLYLNVYVPARDGKMNMSAAFSTFFWIYGGGYSVGDKNEFDWYDGKNLATSRNVIVVEPNYRLGALGFLGLAALKNESNGTTGNYGVQDQQLALKFAYNNVEKFGGNQEHITIAGESAGAISVCWHLASKDSSPYFRSAVMESGTCDSPIFYIKEDFAFEFGNELTKSVGCDPTASSDKILSCLRSLPDRKFCGTKWPVPVPGTNHSIIPPLSLVFPWGPTIDGDSRGLLTRPINVIGKQSWAIKPLIIGTNHDEGSIFTPLTALQVPHSHYPLRDADIPIVLEYFYNETTTKDIISQYSEITPNDKKMNLILRDSIFLCPSQYAAEEMSLSTNVWLYQFVPALDTWVDYDAFGDYHTLEMDFVFDNEWPPIIHTFGPREKKLASDIGAFWTNLAHFNDANGGDVPLNWPTYKSSTREYMTLDFTIRVNDNLEKEVCEFWRYRYSKTH
eukprot:m.17513 g.17513  ORF g.17513 m.17513 type:complete len:559 (-) comp6041_c0_seq1:141-1817(-)